MRALQVIRSKQHPVPDALFAAVVLLAPAIFVQASTTQQLVLDRDHAPAGQIKGVVDLVVDPGIDAARVNITVDGQTVVEGLGTPYHVTVDFGPTVVQHKI